jgi:hypothetical protein
LMKQAIQLAAKSAKDGSKRGNAFNPRSASVDSHAADVWLRGTAEIWAD